jgi:hypothetical protein
MYVRTVVVRRRVMLVAGDGHGMRIDGDRVAGSQWRVAHATSMTGYVVHKLCVLAIQSIDHFVRCYTLTTSGAHVC